MSLSIKAENLMLIKNQTFKVDLQATCTLPPRGQADIYCNLDPCVDIAIKSSVCGPESQLIVVILGAVRTKHYMLMNIKILCWYR